MQGSAEGHLTLNGPADRCPGSQVLPVHVPNPQAREALGAVPPQVWQVLVLHLRLAIAPLVIFRLMADSRLPGSFGDRGRRRRVGCWFGLFRNKDETFAPRRRNREQKKKEISEEPKRRYPGHHIMWKGDGKNRTVRIFRQVHLERHNLAAAEVCDETGGLLPGRSRRCATRRRYG